MGSCRLLLVAHMGSIPKGKSDRSAGEYPPAGPGAWKARAMSRDFLGSEQVQHPARIEAANTTPGCRFVKNCGGFGHEIARYPLPGVPYGRP